jgi:hypothetical protein
MCDREVCRRKGVRSSRAEKRSTEGLSGSGYQREQNENPSEMRDASLMLRRHLINLAEVVIEKENF